VREGGHWVRKRLSDGGKGRGINERFDQVNSNEDGQREGRGERGQNLRMLDWTWCKMRKDSDKTSSDTRSFSSSPPTACLSLQAEAMHEVRVLSQLNHPNVIKYLDSFNEGSTLYIVTELAEGGNLTDALKRIRQRGGLLPEKQVRVNRLDVVATAMMDDDDVDVDVDVDDDIHGDDDDDDDGVAGLEVLSPNSCRPAPHPFPQDLAPRHQSHEHFLDKGRQHQGAITSIHWLIHSHQSTNSLAQ
jgi:hypothetical protein